MLYWVVKIVLTPILRVLYRPWVEGAENIPRDGAALIASNHQSWMDWIFLPLMVPRKITFLAKSDYFTGTGIKGAFQRAFFTGTGQVPIERTGGSASAEALATGLKILGDDRLLGVYPEGTRSPDGRLFRGKTGVARMALAAGVPVIPVAMVGLYDVAPEGRLIPKIHRVGLRIGKPLDFSRYEGMEDSPQVLRSITDEIMYALMVAGGQEYVDTYAAQAKAETKAARAAAMAAEAGGTAEAAAVDAAPTRKASLPPPSAPRLDQQQHHRQQRFHRLPPAAPAAPAAAAARQDVSVEIRDAVAADAAGIAAIYAAEVRTGYATFDLEPPPVEHWAEVIGAARGTHHVLVALEAGVVLGYAKSGTFRARPAYDTTVETSIYLQRPGSGLGTALYGALFARLDGSEAHLAVANIALPNPASVRLHERFGFAASGTLHEVGRKFGQWRDVACYQRVLA